MRSKLQGLLLNDLLLILVNPEIIEAYLGPLLVFLLLLCLDPFILFNLLLEGRIIIFRKHRPKLVLQLLVVEGCDLLDHIMALVIRQSFSLRLGGITLPVRDLLIYKLEGLF